MWILFGKYWEQQKDSNPSAASDSGAGTALVTCSCIAVQFRAILPMRFETDAHERPSVLPMARMPSVLQSLDCIAAKLPSFLR
ncbi:hypothetical protein TRIP_E190125 [uncultured Spirochaetota bacterium]|nr:hypothetical protein TRIP_E190125 [uncultured Spirochaetota bacterium]